MEWEKEVGRLVTNDNGGSAWRVTSYCASPTVTIENCETKQVISTGIYGLNAQGWKRLIPAPEGGLS